MKRNALALLLLGACSHQPQSIIVHAGSADQDTALTATGSATLAVAPDCADLTLTIADDAKRPGDAVAHAQTDEANLLSALRGKGVDDKDIAISELSVDPTYHYDGTRNVLDGYEARVTITATTRAFDQIGTLMQAAADTGVTQMSSRFRRSDLEAIRKQVREQALEAAQAKAKDTAATLGIALGRITAVSDASQSNLYSNEYFEPSGGSGGVGGAQEPLTIEVTLTYEI